MLRVVFGDTFLSSPLSVCWGPSVNDLLLGVQGHHWLSPPEMR